jgi:hypothetical protein
MVVTGFAGLGLFLFQGIPMREAAQPQVVKGKYLAHTNFHEYVENKYFACQPKSIREAALRWDGYLRCQQSKRNVPVDFVLLGDSHAEMLFAGMADGLSDRNVAYYIKNAALQNKSGAFDLILDEIVSSPHIKDVLVHQFWRHRKIDVAAMVVILGQLVEAGKNVYLLEGVPHFPFVPERCGIQRRFRPVVNCSAAIRPIYKSNRAKLDELVALVPRVKLIDSIHYFCDETHCSMSFTDKVLYRDANHLNIHGSKYLIEQILKNDSVSIGW